MATVEQVLSGISNVQFWNEARAASPKFASVTAEGTKEIFSEKGFEALKASDIDGTGSTLNSFFGLSLRIAFQKLDVARARNGFEDSGLMEVYNTPNGGYVQRIAVESIKPITPAYTSLAEGGSVDPFVVRKPKTTQRFFQQNYNYQSLITIQEYQAKQIFLDEYGMGAYIAGILAGLDSGRIAQETVNVKEVFNAGINSTTYPLQSSQIIACNWATTLDALTEDQLRAFLTQIMDVFSAMGAADNVYTGAYNAAGFKTRVDQSDYVLLLRAGVKNRIKTLLRAGAYNPKDLALPIDRIVEVQDFGGLYPYAEEDYTTRLYSIYNPLGDDSGYYISAENGAAAVTAGTLTANTDSNGANIGYTVTSYSVDVSGITGATAENNCYWKDENSELIGAICQKGLIFENRQNPYEVQPIYNPRGIYMNYWANSPNNGINFDYYYNCILLVQASE